MMNQIKFMMSTTISIKKKNNKNKINKIRRFRNNVNNVKVTPGTLRVVAVVQQQPFTGDRGTRTPVQQRCIQKKKGQNHLDNENILTTKTLVKQKTKHFENTYIPESAAVNSGKARVLLLALARTVFKNRTAHAT